MFVGHAALALLAKAARPRPPMVLFLAAAFGPDLLEWGLAAAGHHDRVLSHSLVAVGAAALIAAVAYVMVAKGTVVDGVVVAALWISHWPADFLTGIKPTWPGGPDVGLNLYTLPSVDLAMESALVVFAWLVYRRTVKGRRRGWWAWIPVGLIAAQCAYAVALSRLRPLPPWFDIRHLSR
jgi:hypothetical protein